MDSAQPTQSILETAPDRRVPARPQGLQRRRRRRVPGEGGGRGRGPPRAAPPEWRAAPPGGRADRPARGRARERAAGRGRCPPPADAASRRHAAAHAAAGPEVRRPDEARRRGPGGRGRRRGRRPGPAASPRPRAGAADAAPKPSSGSARRSPAWRGCAGSWPTDVETMARHLETERNRLRGQPGRAPEVGRREHPAGATRSWRYGPAAGTRPRAGRRVGTPGRRRWVGAAVVRPATAAEPAGSVSPRRAISPAPCIALDRGRPVWSPASAVTRSRRSVACPAAGARRRTT